MKKAILYSSEDIRVEEAPIPEVGPNEMLVKVKMCGICTGELMDWYVERKAPYTPGHEILGEVAEVGEGVSSFRVGDRVFVHHHAPCMECEYCRFGDYVHCEMWRRKGIEPGGFAEYFKVLSHVLKVDVLKVPESVSDEDAALIEPLATSVKAVRRANLIKGEAVLSLGLGFMGLLNYEVAKFFGGEVWGVDIDPVRVKLARKWGINAHLPSEIEGKKFRKVFVNPPSPQALLSALNFVRKGGSLILFAPLPPRKNPSIDFNFIYFNEISLIPSYSAGPDDTRMALKLVSKIKPSRFITHRITLEKVKEGFQIAKRKDAIKVMVYVGKTPEE